MITVDEKTSIIGVAELRTIGGKILEELKRHKVILTRRNKPVGVVVDYGEYQRMEQIIEALEDNVLGYMAKERAKKVKKEDYISLDEMERLVGLK